MIKPLKEKISKKEARVGIIGLGYVGLPLAVEFAKRGFHVTGIDVDRSRVEHVQAGKSYIPDVPAKDIKKLREKRLIHATNDYKVLKNTDVIIFCVPTPLRKTREPDISYIIDAAKKVAKHMRKLQLVILESTTYPGTTQETLLPILETSGLKEGKDFFLAFSPERIDPGNRVYTTSNIPKVVGGLSRDSTKIAKLLYSQVVDRVITVSSAQAAEMVKMYENTFRSVNIGLANELALMCNRLGVDVWEVIDAAKTKPFGFMPFYPGPGIGGHCIGIDPLYLSWKARLHGHEPRFIELASQVNQDMPQYVVEKLGSLLNEYKKPLKGSKVMILGVAYKRDVNDTRESPAIEIIDLLTKKGAQVMYHDPYVSKFKTDSQNLKSVPLTAVSLKNSDCVVILTDHSNVNYGLVAKNSKLIFDTRNVLKKFTNYKKRIAKL